MTPALLSTSGAGTSGFSEGRGLGDGIWRQNVRHQNFPGLLWRDAFHHVPRLDDTPAGTAEQVDHRGVSSISVAEVDELEGQSKVEVFEEGDHLLQIVAFLPLNPQLGALDLHLHLELGVAHRL